MLQHVRLQRKPAARLNQFCEPDVEMRSHAALRALWIVTQCVLVLALQSLPAQAAIPASGVAPRPFVVSGSHWTSDMSSLGSAHLWAVLARDAKLTAVASPVFGIQHRLSLLSVPLHTLCCVSRDCATAH